MASLARLTSLSTQTLSLLLERQRSQSLPLSAPSDLHLAQIRKNLQLLRSGILEVERTNTSDGEKEATKLLRRQFDRMHDMVGSNIGVERLDAAVVAPPPAKESAQEIEMNFKPYTDEPTPDENADPGTMLQTQRDIMDEQDVRLSTLSHSITRQHHISLQINDELEEQSGLLDELSVDVDNTSNRLGSTRRRLDKLAKGARENSSTVAIATLILVLLILIIVFKT